MDCFLLLFYSTWALFTTCSIHTSSFFLLCLSAFCLTFILRRIHRRATGGSVSCQWIFGMPTGAVRDQTFNLPINRWPALPPELPPLKKPIKATFGTIPAFIPPPLSWQNDGCWIISVLLQWHEDSVHPSVHLGGLAGVVVQRLSGPISSWSSSSPGGDTPSQSRDDLLCVSWVWTTNTARSNVYISPIWQMVKMIAGCFLCCS